MNHYDNLPQFDKDFSKLVKKYKTLKDDFEKFIQVLMSHPLGVGKNFTIIHSSYLLKIVKARMACRALCDRSLRIIYAYFQQKQRIEFIELYYKGSKTNEDHRRIKEYLKNHEAT